MNQGGPGLITAPQTQLRAGKCPFWITVPESIMVGKTETGRESTDGSRTRKMDDHISSAYTKRRMGETGKEGEAQVGQGGGWWVDRIGNGGKQ